MKLFKKIAKRACLFTALIFLFVACQPGASGLPNSGDSEEEIENPSNQNENTETEEATITKDPETYGESSLPDLTEASSFAGQAYCNNEKGDAIFFNTDNTVLIKEKAGSSDIMQWKKYSLFSYTYDDAAKILTAKPKGLYFGDKLYTTVEGILSNALLGTKIEAIYEGYTNVIIPEEIINYRRQEYKNRLEKGTIKFNCSIGDDNSLILEDDIKDEEEYEYEQDNIDIELEYDEIYGYRISISKGSDKLNNPFIFSVEDGVFTGADYKWVFEGSTATFKKLGNFSGKIDFDYGSCYLTLTEATDDIAWGIKSLANEKKEYELNKKKKDDSENHIEKYYPILKTINFDVIGSDGLVAYKNAQTYITDESETEWSKETLKLFNTSYVEGIYSNEECTRSVIGKEILDGIKVYVKLYNLTAQQYLSKVGIIQDDLNAKVTIISNTNDLIQNPLTLEALDKGYIWIKNPKGLEIFYIKNNKTKTTSNSSVIFIDVNKNDVVSLYGDNTRYGGDLKETNINCDVDCYLYGNVMSLICSTKDTFDLNPEDFGEQSGTFEGLFKDNIHIKNHPSKEISLPATKLVRFCYSNMFEGCTELTKAPVLVAEELAYGCYESMFNECKKLYYVKCLAKNVDILHDTYIWLRNVSKTGFFITEDEEMWKEAGSNGIPEGWIVNPDSKPGVFITINVPEKSDNINIYRDGLIIATLNDWSFGKEKSTSIIFNDKYLEKSKSYTYKYRAFDENREFIKEDNLGTYTPKFVNWNVSITGGKASYSEETGILSVTEFPEVTVTPESVDESIKVQLKVLTENNSNWYFFIDREDKYVDFRTPSLKGQKIKLGWRICSSKLIGDWYLNYEEIKSIFDSTNGLPDGYVTVPTE